MLLVYCDNDYNWCFIMEDVIDSKVVNELERDGSVILYFGDENSYSGKDYDEMTRILLTNTVNK